MNAPMPSAFSAPYARRAALAAVIAAAVLYGCGREGAPGGHGGAPGMGAPAEVNVYTVQAKTVPATFQYTAQIAGSPGQSSSAPPTLHARTSAPRDATRSRASPSASRISFTE